MENNNVNNEIQEIAKILSGEMALRKKEEAIKKAKIKAVKEQKDKRRKDIIDGSIELEKDAVQEKKVVQNIKLYEWKAPDRYEFKFNTKYFFVIVAISLVFILLLAILGHYWLMASIIALLFFIYVAGTTKPELVKHNITARGIDTGNKLYEWFMLRDFYFTKRGDQYLLIVNTKLNLPSALIMLLDKKEVEPIFVLLQDKILYKDIRKQDWLDKLNYGEYISLDEI
mgnify:CR=1 FL=1